MTGLLDWLTDHLATARGRAALLAVGGFVLAATGVGLVLGGLVVPLVAVPDTSTSAEVSGIVAVAVTFAGVAGLVSEPLVSRWLAKAGDPHGRR